MRDKFNREITYLRISLTERCNLRCVYCMPADGIAKKPHAAMLTHEEIITAAQVAAEFGITKIRLTGGEPLVKRDIVELVANLAAIHGIEKLCMTTNGAGLAALAGELKSAGLGYLNVSLDTLDATKFAQITRVGRLRDTLAGVEAALAAGFSRIKLNSVLIGGFNDGEVAAFARLGARWGCDVRFIELMPMLKNALFTPRSFAPYTLVLARLCEALTRGEFGDAWAAKLRENAARLGVDLRDSGADLEGQMAGILARNKNEKKWQSAPNSNLDESAAKCGGEFVGGRFGGERGANSNLNAPCINLGAKTARNYANSGATSAQNGEKTAKNSANLAQNSTSNFANSAPNFIQNSAPIPANSPAHAAQNPHAAPTPPQSSPHSPRQKGEIFALYLQLLDGIAHGVESPPGSTARLFALDGAPANIGLISPVSEHFCDSCNRIRLTADGKLKPCLHSAGELSLKGLSREQMREVFAAAIGAKPEKHDVLSYDEQSKAGRFMNQIGG